MHRLTLFSKEPKSISDKKSSDSSNSFSINFSIELIIIFVLYPKSLKNEITSSNDRYLFEIPFVSYVSKNLFKTKCNLP